jgi:hypothetical protein
MRLFPEALLLSALFAVSFRFVIYVQWLIFWQTLEGRTRRSSSFRMSSFTEAVCLLAAIALCLALADHWRVAASFTWHGLTVLYVMLAIGHYASAKEKVD